MLVVSRENYGSAKIVYIIMRKKKGETPGSDEIPRQG